MSRPAITVENLSKAYHIGLKEDRADTLVGAVQGLVRAPLKNFRRLARMNTFRHCDESDDIFWALRDVSFEVAEGEVVGIIGRNGAGKSTLLKILSRITEPTSGRAVIRGRVSSLLEVGTGFHQELTGRENVYMNGTILGMTRREIDRKFDEIVDFSGVEKFLDTPIKHYSSGMKVRLAFSVAAHLEPEILIIDEVLAVGDAEFQRKCLGKMKDAAQGGRTVLFVSHNMPAVANLCSRSLLLQNGGVELEGNAEQVIAKYLSAFNSSWHTNSAYVANGKQHRPGLREAHIETAELVDLSGAACSTFPMGAGFRVRVRAISTSVSSTIAVAIAIFDDRNTRICLLQSEDTARRSFKVSNLGSTIIDCEVPECNLMPGSYRMNLALHGAFARDLLDFIEGALQFDVVAHDVYGTGIVPSIQSQIFLQVQWSDHPAVLQNQDACRS